MHVQSLRWVDPAKETANSWQFKQAALLISDLNVFAHAFAKSLVEVLSRNLISFGIVFVVVCFRGVVDRVAHGVSEV